MAQNDIFDALARPATLEVMVLAEVAGGDFVIVQYGRTKFYAYKQDVKVREQWKTRETKQNKQQHWLSRWLQSLMK